MASLRELIMSGEHVVTSCPVCGRDITLNRDGTLMNHFDSFMNQDDPTRPPCIGGGMEVVDDACMNNDKHEVP